MNLNIEIFKKHVNSLPNISYLLNDLINRLEVIVHIQECYLNQYSSNKSLESRIKDFQLVIFSSLILELCKYMEFYTHYKEVLNYFFKDKVAQKINKELSKLKLRTFRNTYISHLFDEKGNPITSEEFMSFLISIENEHKDLQAFFFKIHTYPFLDEESLLAILKKMKVQVDQIIKDYLNLPIE